MTHSISLLTLLVLSIILIRWVIYESYSTSSKLADMSRYGFEDCSTQSLAKANLDEWFKFCAILGCLNIGFALAASRPVDSVWSACPPFFASRVVEHLLFSSEKALYCLVV